MTTTLSLFVIEDGLAELLLAQQDTLADIAKLEALEARKALVDSAIGTTKEERDELTIGLIEARHSLSVIEHTLQEYISLEVRKVDNYHHFLVAVDNLAADIRREKTASDRRIKRLEAAAAWLKERAIAAMKAANKKRVDGSAGRYLLLKGNGGLAPLQIDGWDAEKKQWDRDPGLLPAEFRDVTVTLPRDMWNWLLAARPSGTIDAVVKSFSDEPSNARIREALKDDPDAVIPGARLAVRGEHLEVK